MFASPEMAISNDVVNPSYLKSELERFYILKNENILGYANLKFLGKY
jgi:hypothetical protein